MPSGSAPLSVICVAGSAPFAVKEELARQLMEKNLCELATTSHTKQHKDVIHIVVDVPNEHTTCTPEDGASHDIHYFWDPGCGSDKDEFIQIVSDFYKNFKNYDRFTTTRGGARSTSFLGAVKEGLGSDGGLFMLKEIPRMPRSQLIHFCEATNLSYIQAAQIIIEQLVDSTMSPTELFGFLQQAYAPERWSYLEDICPLRPLLERQQRAGNMWMRHVSTLELYHGPTAAFKDFALQLFPHYFNLSVTRPTPQYSPPLSARGSSSSGLSGGSTRHWSSKSASFSSALPQNKREDDRGQSGLSIATTIADYPIDLPPVPTAGSGRFAMPVTPHGNHPHRLPKRLPGDQHLILAATSGDTGVAAISGFANINSPSIKVVVLYPLHGVSPVQQLQMLSMDDGHRVRVYGVKGDFDFCQTTVKNIFNNVHIKDKLARMKPKPTYLSSANSINWGRLIPQVVYYFWAYRQLVRIGMEMEAHHLLTENKTATSSRSATARPSIQLGNSMSRSIGTSAVVGGGGAAESGSTATAFTPSPPHPLLETMLPSNFSFGWPVDVVVPCGNFGNILAAFIAKLMGLPLRRLVVASNENDVLFEFIQTGRYTIASRELAATASPSIDILIASNVERFLFLLSGGDVALVGALMHQLHTAKSFALPDHLKELMQKTFWAGRCTEEQCGKTIQDVFQASRGQRLLDTHTAVAVAVAQQYREAMQSKESANDLDADAEDDDSEQYESSEPGSPKATSPSSKRRRRRATRQKPPPVLEVPLIIASTAHWSKFPDAVYRALRGRSMTKKFDPYNDRRRAEAAAAATSGAALADESSASNSSFGREVSSLTLSGTGASSRPGSNAVAISAVPPPAAPSVAPHARRLNQLAGAGGDEAAASFDLQEVVAHALTRYREIGREGSASAFHTSPPHPQLVKVLEDHYQPISTLITPGRLFADGSRPPTGADPARRMIVRQMEKDEEAIVASILEFCCEAPKESDANQMQKQRACL